MWVYDVEDSLNLIINFNVKGKARPRFDGRSGHAFMPSSYVNNKDQIQWLLREVLFERPEFFSAASPFKILTLQLRPIPKGRSKRDREQIRSERPPGSYARGNRRVADLDNMVGTLMDAGVGILWADDDQVVSSTEDRIWADFPGAVWCIQKLKGVPTWKNTLSVSSAETAIPLLFTESAFEVDRRS